MSALSRLFSNRRFGLAASALVFTAAFMNAQSAEAPQYNTDISIAEVMAATIMPATDALWNAIQLDVVDGKEKLTGPATDDAWLALRNQAVTLASVTNLLMIPEMKISKDPTSKEHGEGELSPAEMTKLRNENLKAFNVHAQNLHNLAMKLIQAIDKKDLKTISDAGGDLDDVCKACHQQFWYPNG